MSDPVQKEIDEYQKDFINRLREIEVTEHNINEEEENSRRNKYYDKCISTLLLGVIGATVFILYNNKVMFN